MLFNSLEFFWFLLAGFSAYWLLGSRRRKAQNLLLLGISYWFYGAWDIRFLGLILVSSGIDFLAGFRIHSAKKKSQQRIWLGISIGVNIGMLGFFKYYNFFMESLSLFLGSHGIIISDHTLDLILPVGISFYTFQTLSYTLDIFRGRMEPTHDPVAFFTFVAFFPQLVAGPIERASHLLPQFTAPRKFLYGFSVTGLRLILWGLFKKIVIADRLAAYVEYHYDLDSNLSGLSALLGGFFFLIQIYCDFSAYSDIAIGTGRLFGFSIRKNFETPLLSKSLKEFWTRWHTSLNSWFVDYLYIPLGGSRVPLFHYYTNILIIFLISGLWHGANDNFVIWGLWFGLAFILEDLFRKAVPLKGKIVRITGWMWTFAISTFVFILFPARSLDQGWEKITAIFSSDFWNMEILNQYSSELNYFLPNWAEGLFLFGLVLFLMLADLWIGRGDPGTRPDDLPRATRWGIYYSLILVILFFGAYGKPVQFIYFQF